MSRLFPDVPLRRVLVHSTNWRYEHDCLTLTYLAYSDELPFVDLLNVLPRDANAVGAGVASVVAHAVRHLAFLARQQPELLGRAISSETLAYLTRMDPKSRAGSRYMITDEKCRSPRTSVTLNNETLRRTYEIPLARGAVESLVREAIDAPAAGSTLVPGLFRGRRFVGNVRPGSFEIWVRRWSYNSLAPRMQGRIQPTDGGSRVTVQVGAPPVTRVGLALLIASTALGGTPILLSVGYPAIFAIGLGLLLLFFSVVVFRGSTNDAGFPRSEAIELMQFLDSVFADFLTTGSRR